MLEMEPIEQRTMADNALVALREAILTGKFSPGDQLRETRVADQLGISRAPVREALQILEEEGLVERIPFRGSFVAEISETVINEIEALRKVLEPYATVLAMKSMSDTGVTDELKGAVEELKRTATESDVAGCIEAHLNFHRILYRAAGNSVLFDIWSSWESQLKLYLMIDHRSFSNLLDVTVEHQEILNAILEQDVARVRQSLKNHIHTTPTNHAAAISNSP
jgi:DNA-binding GntR family transcriptional regulator